MKLTLNQAARECGRSKSTLSNALKTGKLSAERGDKGSYLIDPAELFRVFPKTSPDDQSGPITNPHKANANRDIEQEIEALHRQIATLNLERERERAQLSDQISDLRRRLDQESEERRSLTAMLTDQRARTAPPARRGFLGMFGRAG